MLVLSVTCGLEGVKITCGDLRRTSVGAETLTFIRLEITILELLASSEKLRTPASVLRPSQVAHDCRKTLDGFAKRVKSLSWRPGDPLTLERERQDAARDKVLEFTREQRSCDVKNSWLQRSDHQFLRRTVDRRVRAAVAHRETHVDQRRRRFVHCCTEEKQAKMEERLKTLRERRERERQELVSEKLELQFR
ncbi:putative coiled-coil domain-containing protein 11-like [Scophthalmus maximus]|uniref:Putative coiled-coil domain-containing protein 11-like n=1 Tax=Scophthalmus maximus TaxID=52904 RepID=A0A2U9CDT7_SCOMX|nr:putative coiled-coil domain-containing protein 11-like [Scophthalmus maximus]